jgi:hypothetical protein
MTHSSHKQPWWRAPARLFFSVLLWVIFPAMGIGILLGTGFLNTTSPLFLVVIMAAFGCMSVGIVRTAKKAERDYGYRE